MTHPRLFVPALAVSLAALACGPQYCVKDGASDKKGSSSGDEKAKGDGALPLCIVKDVPLPGGSSRFDYQDIDTQRGLLIIAHMGDSKVVIVNLAGSSVKKTLSGIATARGVLAAPSANRIFASAAATDELVIIDADTLDELRRVSTGGGPDGIAYDAADHTVAVSAQHDGDLSLIANDGDGERKNIHVGNDTGNVAFDEGRGHFFVTVTDPDQLIELTPSGEIVERMDVDGCIGAHGLRIHPNGKSALVACESNATIARVDLEHSAHDVVTAGTSLGPDVLSIDPDFKWVYVAAEGGDLKVFDISGDGLKEIDSERVGGHAHSVVVDPATHRSYFPLEDEGDGPVLRIMAP